MHCIEPGEKPHTQTNKHIDLGFEERGRDVTMVVCTWLHPGPLLPGMHRESLTWVLQRRGREQDAISQYTRDPYDNPAMSRLCSGEVSAICACVSELRGELSDVRERAGPVPYLSALVDVTTPRVTWRSLCNNVA